MPSPSFSAATSDTFIDLLTALSKLSEGEPARITTVDGLCLTAPMVVGPNDKPRGL
jgi:hypothetical protein